MTPEVRLAQARAALRAAAAGPGRARSSTRCWPTTPGSGGRSGSAGWRPWTAGDFAAAQSSFNAVYGQVPGELAPKLALALACERGGEGAIAEGLYRTCASTDANYVAAGGLRHGPDPRRLAATSPARSQALDLVPSTSRSYPEARRLRARQLYESGQGLPALAQAMDSLQRRPAGPAGAGRADGARSWSGPWPRSTRPDPKTERHDRPVRRPATTSLRDGLEATYRALAGHRERRANSATRWSTRPTPCEGGPCDDRPDGPAAAARAAAGR